MKAKILISLVVIAGCLLAFASTASADKVFATNCGDASHFASAISVQWNGANNWSWTVNSDCQSGKTFEFEFQRSTDGGASWFDTLQPNGTSQNDFQITTSALDANKNIMRTYGGSTNLNCQSTSQYRLRAYDANGSTWTSSPVVYC